MIFTDDTEESLRAAVWLVNSAKDPDALITVDDEASLPGPVPLHRADRPR